MTSGRIAQLVSGTAIGSALLANIFLFLPLTLFLGNEKEFSVSFGSILVTYVAPAITLIAIVAIVSMLLPKKAFRTFAVILGVLSILIWVQGNLFVWSYGLLNGAAIDWNENRLLGWVELAIWLSAIFFVIWKSEQVGEFIFGIAMTLMLLQFSLFGFNAWNSKEQLEATIDIERENVAADNIFRYSNTENIIHIVADGFQADVMDEILNTGDSGKQLSEALSGFTVFSKNLGAFPYTHMSVPAFLSSNVYRNQMPIDEYMKKSFGEDSIISLVRKNGYEVDIAVSRGVLMDVYDYAKPDNLFPVDNGGVLVHDNIIRNEAARLFDLSLFRGVPHDLKARVYNDQKWIFQSLSQDTIPVALQNFAHMAFLRKSSKEMTVDRKTPVYKLFHLMLSHNPMVTTNDCRPANKILPTARENVIVQARCGLNEIALFLDKLKSSGVYESSTIVVMGDHGAWVQPKNLKGVLNPEKDFHEVINPAVVALATPFFAVKRPGDTGAIKYSDAPSSITDFAKTIASIKNYDNEFNGESVFDLSSDVARERLFAFYHYKKSEWVDNHLGVMEEFRILGDAADSATWRKINTYSPDGVKQAADNESFLWVELSDN